MINPCQLSQICPNLKGDRLTKVVNAINEICPQYGIVNYDILHEFLANVAHESGEFRLMEENLNYTAERLRKIWPHRFPTLKEAQNFAHSPQAIANKVYGGRADLGNTQPADGWIFRGSGFIQLTGRRNHTMFLSYYNTRFEPKKGLTEMAELLRKDTHFAMHSACWFFSIAKGLVPHAVNDNMKLIVKRINGAYIGMNERVKYYERAKQVLK
jgi:putative chitinase